MCYVNSSANTILQHFSINYLHLIQPATEMHTVIVNTVAQDPSKGSTKKGTTIKSMQNLFPLG